MHLQYKVRVCIFCATHWQLKALIKGELKARNLSMHNKYCTTSRLDFAFRFSLSRESRKTTRSGNVCRSEWLLAATGAFEAQKRISIPQITISLELTKRMASIIFAFLI